MDSVTKDTTVIQNAGAKTYSSWGAWSINLSANVTTIAAVIVTGKQIGRASCRERVLRLV